MNNGEKVFITGDKLPWVHEAVLAIIDVAPGGSAKKEKESKSRRDAINTYVIEVERLRINAFGGEHVCERKTIAKKLQAALQVYFNKVRRKIFKQWEASEHVDTLFDLLKPSCDPTSFGGSDFLFYNAQKSGREGYVTNEIDPSYVVQGEQLMEIMDQNEEEILYEDEITDKVIGDVDFVCPEEKTFLQGEVNMHMCRTRSGSTFFPFVQDPTRLIACPKPHIQKTQSNSEKMVDSQSQLSL